MKRSGALKRRPMKRKRRARRHDPNQTGAWHAAVFRANGARCAVCGNEHKPDLEAHHVIDKGWLWNRRWDFDDVHALMWDERNGMVVCTYPCHALHTLAAKRIPRYCLPAAALDFAAAHGFMTKLEADYPAA